LLWLDGLGLTVSAASALGFPVAISAGVPDTGELSAADGLGYAPPAGAPVVVARAATLVAPGSGYDPPEGWLVGV
jgi:hypothetical protein